MEREIAKSQPAYRNEVLADPRVMAKKMAARFFKDDQGDSFILTDGQADIFLAILEPQYTRVAIRTITQYGKSEVASMALILCAIERREKILIIAPRVEQAEIIMNNVIKHLFDDPKVTQMIVYEGSLEKLRQERSKKRITFRNGSEIFILTANADEVAKEGKSLMGFGATIVVADESSLIPDIIFSKILRMVGSKIPGRKHQRKMIQLGNPFEQNHFFKAFHNKAYRKIIVKREQAIVEGRVTRQFLDEAKGEMSELEWLIFYECEFPVGGANDALIPWDWIAKAINQVLEDNGEKQAGLDVARFGRDKSIYGLRNGPNTKKLKEFEKMDTMQLVGWSGKLIDEDQPNVTGIDAIGIGAGVADRHLELGRAVVGVNVGEAAEDDPSQETNPKDRFTNKRAYYYWHLRDQFEPDETGKSRISIPDDPELIKELQEIRYKIASDKKIRIEEKAEMKKRLGRSPDKADALMLTFAPLTYNDTAVIIL